MSAIRYEAPQSVAQAVGLMAADPGASIIAGGTDLLVQFRAVGARITEPREYQLKSRRYNQVDELNGWGRFLKGGVEVEVCPGNHQTLLEEPNVRVMARKLRDAMDRASPGPGVAVTEAPRQPASIAS